MKRNLIIVALAMLPFLVFANLPSVGFSVFANRDNVTRNTAHPLVEIVESFNNPEFGWGVSNKTKHIYADEISFDADTIKKYSFDFSIMEMALQNMFEISYDPQMRIIEILEGPPLNNVIDVERRFEISYDVNGTLDTAYLYQRNADGDFVPSFLFDFLIDDDSFSLMLTMYMGEMIIYGNIVIGLDAQGRIISETTHMSMDQENWELAEKTEYSYHPEDNTTLQDALDFFNKYWALGFMVGGSDMPGMFAERIDYNNNGGVWVPRKKYEYAYANGKRIEEIEYQYFNEDWVVNDKTLYAYNQYGDLKYELRQNPDGNEFVDHYKYEHVYAFETRITEYPFFEGFEDYDNGFILTGGWDQFAGPDYFNHPWNAEDNFMAMIPPRTGDMKAVIHADGQSTLVRPIVLEANKDYKLKLYAAQGIPDPNNATIKAVLARTDDLSGEIETIIPETNVPTAGYHGFSGVFSSEIGGLYYIGITGTVHNMGSGYLSLDDIRINYNYAVEPDEGIELPGDAAVAITGAGFIGAYEVPTLPEDFTDIPNPSFMAIDQQVWQLIGTGTITLTFQNNSTEDIWIAYYVGGAWNAHEIPAGDYVNIEIDLGAKDARFEFALGRGGNPTLPVELSYFNAIFVANENSVKLNWKTASETQMLGYQIYRSMDKVLTNASLITGTIIDASNSSTGANYSFLDSDIENGTYYYWLEALSYNSSEYYGYQSVVVDIPSAPQLPEISSMSNAYPNPFKDMTNVDIAIKGGETGNFTIYNMLGQVVYKKSLKEGNVKIEWNGRDKSGNRCGSGVYFYKLTTPTKSETKKMVIMK